MFNEAYFNVTHVDFNVIKSTFYVISGRHGDGSPHGELPLLVDVRNL